MNEHEEFPFEPVTIAQLEALAERYFPSKQPEKQGEQAQQGRASVMNSLDESDRNARRRSVEWRDDHPLCRVCGKEFDRRGTRQRYCSEACRQRAYRMRKKAG